MSKSQITMFMILGIVLLVVFGFLYYSMSFISETKNSQNLEKLVSEILTTTAIEYYTTICLDEAAKKSTFTIARQGGAIFCDQYPDYDSIPIDKKPACANAMRTNPSSGPLCGIQSPSLVDYPNSGLGIHYLGGNPQIKYNLGIKSWQKFCSPFGPNKYRSGQIYSSPCQVLLGYDYADPGDDYSTQKQYSDYLAYLVHTCTGESQFPSITKQGHEINTKDIKAEVTFGDHKTDFDIAYGLEIKIRGEMPVTKILNFHTSLPIRFKTMGSYALNMMNQEAQNLLFDINDFGHQNSFMYTPGLIALRPASSDANYIVRFSDQFSIVEGKSLLFDICIQNRPPALNWIHQEGLATTSIDLVTLRGDPLLIPPYSDKPFAIDPDDDDSISFSYSGWRIDNKEKIQPNCCQPSGSENCFSFSGLDTCTIDNGKAGQKWNINTDGTAIYTTQANNKDVGIHTTTVKAIDEHGFIDSQDVKIFVAECTVDSQTLTCPKSTGFFCGGVTLQEIWKTQESCESMVDLNSGAGIIQYGLCNPLQAGASTYTGTTCANTESSFCGSGMCQDFCNDGPDNDGDGAIDACDSDCGVVPLTETNCNDNLDSDCDGFLDCALGNEDLECSCP